MTQNSDILTFLHFQEEHNVFSGVKIAEPKKPPVSITRTSKKKTLKSALSPYLVDSVARVFHISVF